MQILFTALDSDLEVSDASQSVRETGLALAKPILQLEYSGELRRYRQHGDSPSFDLRCLRCRRSRRRSRICPVPPPFE